MPKPGAPARTPAVAPQPAAESRPMHGRLEMHGPKSASGIALLTCVLLLVSHTVYLSRTLPQFKQSGFGEIPKVAEGARRRERDLPDVIIYRRTKKTGSSSMLEELLRVTRPLGYFPIYDGGMKARETVRSEGVGLKPRRLFVAEHNSVTRDDLPGRTAIIIDTVLDGYRQMTSYCRFVTKIEKCDKELEECVRKHQNQKFYRWAGRSAEDQATFIDMPLSSAHPALSTTIIRRLFPNATLDIKKRNSAGSACPEDPSIRKVYEQYFGELETQIMRLRMRLLVLAGYPTNAKARDVTLTEMIDAAEALERKKYLEREKYKFGKYESTKDVSQEHRDLKWGKTGWIKTASGEVILKE